MTTPTPAPEPMGGPDFDTPLAPDEAFQTFMWGDLDAHEHFSVSRDIKRARTLAGVGYEVRRVRLVPSTSTAPPSADRTVAEEMAALGWNLGTFAEIAAELERLSGELRAASVRLIAAEHASRPAPPATGGREAKLADIITAARHGLTGGAKP